MRTIKFRAWDDYNKEMWYPVKPGLSGLRSCDILERFENVMQFTGLKDKNGKEIYEGDILRTDYELIPDVSVFWHEQEARWQLKFIGIIGANSECELNDTISYTSEIIGNIYENPELIK